MFVSERPDLMKFWDYNNNLDPSTLSLRSNETVHWKCEQCGYEWTTTVVGRAHTKDGKCPCHDVNRYIKQGVNDALTVHPELALDYHPELNPGIDIGLEGVASHKKIHWKCHNCSYEWDSPIYSRVFHGNEKEGVGKCPACVNNQHVTSYGTLYPRLEELYSPNNKIPLKDVTRSQKEKYKWMCEKHGEYESTIHSMIRSVKHDNIGCPFCHGNKVSKENSFGYCHPELILDWSPENKVSPYEVTVGSHLNVLWKCNVCGNEWKASVYERHRGRAACKVCYPFGKRGMLFCEKFPEAVQYYSDKNEKPITAFSVTDMTEVLWKCEKGHEFTDSFYNYNQRGHFKCNVCRPKKIMRGVNDLLTCHPHLADWYDTEKNEDPIETVSAGSTSEDTWWKCDNGHSFQRSVKKMAKDGLCPVCEGWIVIPGVNDLLTAYPQVGDIWDYDKDPDGPENTYEKTVMYLPFRCDKNHHYKATLKRMVNYNFRCLVCNSIILDPSVNSVKAIDPELAEEWSPNNTECSDQVLYSLIKPRLWVCPVCKGEYKAVPSKRHVGDDSCPYCNNRAVLPGFNDIASVYPGLVPEWSKNNTIPPEQAGIFQRVSRRWMCLNCGGDYLATIKEKLAGTKQCEYCRNRRTLTGHNDLASNAPEMLDEWSPRNKKSPHETNFFLLAPRMWKCKKCGKEYGMPIQEKKARGDDACPYCNGKRVLPGVNDIATTDPVLAGKWSPDNKLPVTLVKRDYIANYLWRCEKCDQNYRATIQQQLSGEAKCPFCENIILLSGYNDLKTVYPEIAGNWSVNNEYPADHVLATRVAMGLWTCDICHSDHYATISDRLSGKDNCPTCSGQRVLSGFNDLGTVHPEFKKIWSPNNSRTVDNVLASSNMSFLWVCLKCHGEYLATIDDQLKKEDVCPYCAGRRMLSGYNSLNITHPDLMPEWLEAANIIIGMKPEHVYEKSTEKAWWQCLDCGYKYPLSIKIKCEKYFRNMKTCPYCAGRREPRQHFV